MAGLHLALLLWLLGHPGAGVEPGFLLAWWALLGVFWGAEPLAGLLSPLLGCLALPFARLAVPWLSTLPLLALLYGGAPWWGILANLLVLPNIDAANIAYNLLKTAAGGNIAIGPVLLGAAKPVHILTASTTVRRIVNMTALTVADANAARQ